MPPRHRSDPPLQCGVPPRCRSGAPTQWHRLGSARALHYNARYRSGPITMRGTASAPHRYGSGPLLQCAFYKVHVGSEQGTSKKTQRPTESHETQPYHCSPRASSNGALHTCPKAFQVCFALNHELRFPRNLWPSFWCPKTVAKPVSPWMTSPVDCVFGP